MCLGYELCNEYVVRVCDDESPLTKEEIDYQTKCLMEFEREKKSRLEELRSGR